MECIELAVESRRGRYLLLWLELGLLDQSGCAVGNWRRFEESDAGESRLSVDLRGEGARDGIVEVR